MKLTENGLDASNLIVKRRYRPHDGDGCLLCGSESAEPYTFYCVQKTGEKVKMVSQYEKQITRSYQLQETVTHKLCADCVRTSGMSNVMFGLIVAVISIAVWYVSYLIHLTLLILPIIGLIVALYAIVTGIRRYTRKIPTRDDGDDTLRDILRAAYPGYAKYMTRAEWEKQNQS